MKEDVPNQGDDGREAGAVRGRSAVWREVWDWGKAIIVALLIAWGIHQFLFQQYVVDGKSMMPTLYNSERLLVDKIPYYFGLPKRGDIIIFRAPKQYAPEGQFWVKRVIGLPGDTIRIANGVLYVDGKAVQEPFIMGGTRGMGSHYDFGPVTVPAGHLFVMGDNRAVSFDSRYIGPIKVSSVVGRVDVMFWPLNKFQVIGTTQEHFLPQSPAPAAR